MGVSGLAKQELTGIILMEPDRVGLKIIDRQSGRLITFVQSGALGVGERPVANYAANMEALVTNLEGFLRTLAEYQVQDYHFYGALEDLDPVSAKYVADQLDVRTGLKVEWMNNSRLMARSLLMIKDEYRAVDPAMARVFVLSIGLSTSTLAYFENGTFETSWNIDLGKATISHLASTLRQTTATPSDIILDYISSKVEYLTSEVADLTSADLIIQGSSVLADAYLGLDQQLGQVDLAEFTSGYQQIISSTDQYVINNYAVDEQSVSWVLPSYLLISQLRRLLRTDRLFVTRRTVFDALVVIRGKQIHRIERMIRTAADNMARRYGVNSAHRDFVTKTACQLFDALAPIHRLDHHYRILLEIASRVDDIGNFISPQGHYRHSAYILEANPLIGLSEQDNRVIAEVSRYHSAESPAVDQHHYQQMDSDLQLPVAKLAAILRVADSLDDSRQQKVDRLDLVLAGDRLKIYAHASDDLVLEKWAFQRKNKLFTDVFGLEPELIAKGEN